MKSASALANPLVPAISDGAPGILCAAVARVRHCSGALRKSPAETALGSLERLPGVG
jgi:hypothetical protein